MNERNRTNGMGEGDASLRLALRGLRTEHAPQRDLWPGIASRIQAMPQGAASRPRRWLLPVSMAASMLVAAGLAWQASPDSGRRVQTVVQQPVAQAAQAPSLVQREASGLTAQYQAALRELDGRAVPVGWRNGLLALDRSAAEIQHALQQQPDSRLLLERLRETYVRRLALSRRALHV